MSRINDVNEHQNDDVDLEEVTQLCNEYSSERKNFHKLGFQCLLKKLKEIEKIILAISKMSENDALQIENSKVNAFQNHVANEASLSTHQHSLSQDLHLPSELTLHSKQILLKIFEKFETHINDFSTNLKIKFHETLNESYCQMDVAVDSIGQGQKTEAKILIEDLLNADIECFDEDILYEPTIVENQPLPSSHNARKLSLPEYLTPFTRSVLNEIFESYETNVNDFAKTIKTQIYEILNGMYGQFELCINKFTEERKSQLKYTAEGVFSNQNEKYTSSLRNKSEATKLNNDDQCEPFDAQLARHFQDLSRLVEAILQKKNDASAREDQATIAEDMHGPLDNEDDTQYMVLPPFVVKTKHPQCRR